MFFGHATPESRRFHHFRVRFWKLAKHPENGLEFPWAIPERFHPFFPVTAIFRAF